MKHRSYLKIRCEIVNVQSRIDEGDPDPTLSSDITHLVYELEKHPDHTTLAMSMRSWR